MAYISPSDMYRSEVVFQEWYVSGECFLRGMELKLRSAILHGHCQLKKIFYSFFASLYLHLNYVHFCWSTPQELHTV